MSNISVAPLFARPEIFLLRTIKKNVVLAAFLISAFYLPIAVFSQVKSAATTNSEIVWTLDKSISGVQFFYAIASCNDKKVVLLKFINNNKYAVDVSWQELFVTKQIQEKSKGFYGMKKLVLSPGETAPRSCSDITNSYLIIQSDRVSPAYIAVIEDFEFSNITVSKHKEISKN